LVQYEGPYTAPAEGYRPSAIFTTRDEIHAHLSAHFLAGHKVPEHAFHRLEVEMGLVLPD
jgi:hypothetical protein